MKKWLGLLITIFVLSGCQTNSQIEETTVEETTHQATTVADSTETKETTIANTKESQDASEEITIGITIKDDEEIISEKKDIETSTDQPLLEVMKEHFDLEEEDAFITSIEGHAQNEKENRWWMFTVNGEMSEVGAGDAYLEDGDQVEWTLSTVE